MDLISMVGTWLLAHFGVGVWVGLAIFAIFAILMVSTAFGGSHPSDHKHDW